MMFFPFLLFIVTLLGYLPIETSDAIHLISKYAPGQTGSIIENNLAYLLDEQKGKLLSVGILISLFATSNSIHAIIRTLNKAYNVKETRNFFFVRALTLLFAILIIFAISIQLLLPVFGALIATLFTNFGISEAAVDTWNSLRWLISYLLVNSVFIFLYKFGPNAKLRLSNVMWGSLFATVGWQLSSYGFSYYVSNFSNYSLAYGSLGSIIILITWFYLLGLILLIGGEINATLEELRHPQSRQTKKSENERDITP